MGNESISIILSSIKLTYADLRSLDVTFLYAIKFNKHTCIIILFKFKNVV